MLDQILKTASILTTLASDLKNKGTTESQEYLVGLHISFLDGLACFNVLYMFIEYVQQIRAMKTINERKKNLMQQHDIIVECKALFDADGKLPDQFHGL